MSTPVAADCSTKTIVNGRPIEIKHDPRASAVDVIRQQIGLTGTKLVCGAGVCGACTVLVDGQPITACSMPACSLDGKQIQTVEQYGAENLHPVQKAFLVHDGLQCGFCTPGFIMEAIHFYDQWRRENGIKSPTRAEIAFAMSGHLCRCGAYIGIYDAIRSACAGDFDNVSEFEFPRAEGVAKVTGSAKYTVDVIYEDMLTGKILGSPHAHAHVKHIDTSRADSMPGVKAIIDILTDPHRVVRFVGHPILAIAAVDEETALQAIETIAIEYEVRPFVIDPVAAESRDSPVVYPEKKKSVANASEGPIPPGSWNGNIRTPMTNRFLSSKKSRAKKALQLARTGQAGLHLIEQTFSTPAQTHTSLEPHSCVAKWDGDRLTVHSSTQSVHLLGRELARHFKIARDNVVVHAEYIGGAFGSKQGMILEHTTTVELARKAGAPVKLVFTRDEEMVLGGFRPTSRIEFSMVVDDDGNQCGITAFSYGCCGTAIQSQNAPWIRFLYEGPKHLEDYDVTANWGTARPFRGPCGPSAFWALEQAVDEAAHRINKNPIELRRQWDKSNVRDRLYDWVETIPAWKNRKPAGSASGRFKTGVGVAVGNWFNAFWNGAKVNLQATADGLVASCAVQDMGQGSRSVIGQAIADELGVPLSSIRVDIGQSNYVAGPISSGSRTTASVFPVSIEAAQMMRKLMVSQANSQLGLRNPRWESGGIQYDGGQMPVNELLSKLAPLEVTSNKRGSNGLLDILGKMPSGDLGINFCLKMTGAICLVQLVVDTRLGRVKPEKVWLGMAVGKITNPMLARSQAYGGVIQSLGITLTEERQWDPTTGTLLSFGLDDYRIPGIGDVPEIELYFDETGFEKKMKAGVCGMSELSTLSISAAIGNAVFNATSWRPTEIPLRPHRVIENV